MKATFYEVHIGPYVFEFKEEGDRSYEQANAFFETAMMHLGEKPIGSMEMALVMYYADKEED